MEEKFIFEGKTTTEAIEKGLKQLKLKKEDVEINILKDEKRSFFSILEPRIVKVELIKKEKKEVSPKKTENQSYKKEKKEMSKQAIEKAEKNITDFLNKFLKLISEEKLKFNISTDGYYITVEILGNNTNSLIGYRGETLNAMQTLLSSVANKEIDEKVRVILDVSGYKEKRKKVLEELADKISKTVIKTGKRITLEPMPAYERKIIHSRLQNNSKITTDSVGEEPHRKVVIELKK